jgi:streptogramin lyase
MKKLAPWPDAGRNRNIDVNGEAAWSTGPTANGEIALMRIDPRTGQASYVRPLPEIARPSGIAVGSDFVIYARLRREEADLVTLRFEKRR